MKPATPIEEILSMLPELLPDELEHLARAVAQLRHERRPVTHKPKRYEHVFVCVGCGCLASSPRSDALTCSPACRVAAHRNGSMQALRALAGNPGLDVHPAAIQRAAAVRLLLPDREASVMSGQVTFEDLREPLWRAYQVLVTKSASHTD